jgi:hypothetical protein
MRLDHVRAARRRDRQEHDIDGVLGRVDQQVRPAARLLEGAPI